MIQYHTLKSVYDYMEKLPVERDSMSIMHYISNEGHANEQVQADDRQNRNPLNDLKQGLDLIFELKSHLDRFHPIATATLIRLLAD